MKFFMALISRFTGRGRALWRYRRGMTKARRHDHQGAINDYSAAIEMPDAPPDVKAMAYYNRALARLAEDDPQAADDLNQVLTMKETQPSVRTEARRKLLRIQRCVDRSGDPAPTASRTPGGSHARLEPQADGKHSHQR
jgi:hypothetical protein